MLPFVFLLSGALASQWDTYPSVPKSASINGFADPIYSKLPECAKECVTLSTKSTPCPYWDTGCFCVMPQWSGLVGSCFAEKCQGSDVASATSLAYSLCESVGANIWMMPASISTELSLAAGTWQVAAATTKDSDFGDNGSKKVSGTNVVTGSASTSSIESASSVAAGVTGGANNTNSSSNSTDGSLSLDSGASVQQTGIAALVLVALLSMLH